MNLFSKKINVIAYLRYLIKRKLYYRLYMYYPVWFFVLNRKARIMYRNHPTHLNDVQQKIIHDFRTHGIAITHISELFSDPYFVGILRAYADSLRATKTSHEDQKEVKSHLLYLLGARPILDLENPAFRFSLERPIIDIMNAYMRMATKFHSLELNVTRPVGDALPIASQRWHRDSDDKKICRAFVYLSDVDETSGPFIYVKGSHYGGPWQSLYRQDPPAGSYPPPGNVEAHVPSSDIMTCFGKAGTIIFADTSGLHRGGHAVSNERYMLTIGFNSEASLTSDKFKFSERFDKTIFDDAIVRYACEV